jgi:MFS transporter, CP family, cyanate transporter
MEDPLASKRNASVSKYRFVIEVIIFLTYAVFGMTWAACGSFLKEVMHDLGLSLSQASFLSTSVSFAKIFGPALAGFLFGILGLRWAFLLASILIGLGIFAPLAPNYFLLLLSRFAMGVGGAMVVVYFTPLVMKWFPAHERLAVNGVNFVSINTGMMVGLFITAPVTAALSGSWRNTLILYSCLSLVMAVLWLVFGKDAEDDKPSATGTKGSGGNTLLDAARNIMTWKLVFTNTGVLSLYLVLFTYFPTFYRDVFGYSKESAIMYAPAIAMSMGIPSSLLGIYLSGKTGLRIPFLRYSGIMLAPATAGMFILNNPALILISAVVTGFALFLAVSPFYTIPQELPDATPQTAGNMMSVFWSISYVMATFNVWFVGKISESSGSMSLGFFYVTVLSLSLFVGSFLIPETGTGARKKESFSQ